MQPFPWTSREEQIRRLHEVPGTCRLAGSLELRTMVPGIQAPPGFP